jgi:hypothetical protein
MSRELVSAALILIGLAAAPAGADSLWNHNGSEMRLRVDGDRRTFVYELPRAGIASQGVERGTVLFEGRISGVAGQYSGTAYVFSAHCKPQGYAVTGELQDDGRRISLSGEAPRRDSNCNVQGSRDDHLVFDFVRSEAPPVTYPPLKEGAVCAVEDPEEYKTCLEKQANQICRGRNPFEDLVRCFREAVVVVYKKSQMSGVAAAIVDTPFIHCTKGVCSMQGGGPSPSCVRLDAKRVRECDGDVVNERCVNVDCPIRRCRKVCSKPQ